MKTTLIIALAAIVFASCSRNRIVELPLTMHDGYGPFKNTAMSGISPEPNDPANPWYKSRTQISSLPEGLTDVQSGTIETNIYQHAYQNYLVGNITKEWYDYLQKSWNWVPDTTMLSWEPVRTQIAFAYGKDTEGATKFVLDTNGNLDLSDDASFTPIDMEVTDVIANKDSLAQVHAVRASVEIFLNNRIESAEIPVLVAHYAAYNMFFSNLACYATTTYREHELAVNSSMFGNLSFSEPAVGLVPKDPASKIESDQTYQKGEYIEIGNEVLKITGVNTNKSRLILERADIPKSELFSSQVGYSAYPFTGEEFTARTPLSLDSLRGKWVFFDFWATWCVPCLEEFPNLRELYAKTDRANFEIVGIVGASTPDDLTSAIETHGLTWPQILSDDISKLYGVSGYPTTLLLDPNGVIIAKNLRGAALEERVLSLIGE